MPCNVSVGIPEMGEFVAEMSEMLQAHRSHMSSIESCLYVLSFALWSFQYYSLVAQWRSGYESYDRRLSVQCQLLHCRVRPWTSCSHTLPLSPSTALWYQFKVRRGGKQTHHATHWPRVHSLAVGNNTSLNLNFHTYYCILQNVIFSTISLTSTF